MLYSLLIFTASNIQRTKLSQDRLSDLPDEILVSILSLLKLEERQRTSILSRRWRYLWTFVTCNLVFDWWAQISRLCRPQSWSGTNNTSRIVIPAMVAGPGRARSPSSIRGPLQSIYSLPCRWKDNSPLAHHRGVTKKEWISPSMSQWIERGACTYTDIYRHEPQKEKIRITHQIL